MSTDKTKSFSFTVPRAYSVKRIIGKGTYGVVCEATNVKTKDIFAIKKITGAFEHTLDAKRAVREVRILSRASHTNVLNCKDIFKPSSFSNWTDLYFSSELMDSDLHKVLSSSQPLTDDHRRFFLYQAVCGLRYLHSAGIIHRDLKPSNFLVNRNCDLKITDLGLVTNRPSTLDDDQTLYVQTRWYRAPELLLGNTSYDASVDIWSLGCVMIELFFRKPVFTGSNYVSQLHKYFSVLPLPTDSEMKLVEKKKALEFLRTLPHPKHNLKSFFSQHRVGVTPDALDLLSAMLQFDPAKRITIDSILAHPYLAPYRGTGDESLHTSPEPLLELSYEPYADKAALKHIMFHEMLRFHPDAAADCGYVLPDAVRGVCEIANPGICKRLQAKADHTQSFRMKKSENQKSNLVSLAPSPVPANFPPDSVESKYSLAASRVCESRKVSVSPPRSSSSPLNEVSRASSPN